MAHDKQALAKWRRTTSRRETRKQRGLTGAALEAAVRNIAAIFPENVMAA